jgi:tetratricopeptide (TPR) repeat protein
VAFPKDLPIRDMMTRIWIDSSDYPKALAYWKQEHELDPKNHDVIEKIAGINFKAGDWEEAIRWYQKEADDSAEPAVRLAGFLNIAKVSSAKLRNTDVPMAPDDRIRIADLGIAALQKATAIDGKNMEIESAFGAIFEKRAVTHGASWAAAIDRASMLTHRLRWVVLKKEADAAAAAANPPPPAGAAPAGTTGG